MSNDDLEVVRDDIVAYLMRRKADLEHEIDESDQAGPWDERDHLHDEIAEVRALLDRLQPRP